MQLLNKEGEVLETTLTCEEGTYEFKNIVAGIYYIKMATEDCNISPQTRDNLANSETMKIEAIEIIDENLYGKNIGLYREVTIIIRHIEERTGRVLAAEIEEIGIQGSTYRVEAQRIAGFNILRTTGLDLEGIFTKDGEITIYYVYAPVTGGDGRTFIALGGALAAILVGGIFTIKKFVVNA